LWYTLRVGINKLPCLILGNHSAPV